MGYAKMKLDEIREVIEEYGINCAFPNQKLQSILAILNKEK